MIALHGYVLGLLHIVNALQDGKSMSHARNAHALQVIVVQGHQGLSDNLILCVEGMIR